MNIEHSNKFTWNPYMLKKGYFYWICNLGQFYEARQIILSMKDLKDIFSGSLSTLIFCPKVFMLGTVKLQVETRLD